MPRRYKHEFHKKLSNPKSTNNNVPFGDDAALVERLTSDGGITFGQHIILKYTSGVLQVCIQPSEISDVSDTQVLRRH